MKKRHEKPGNRGALKPGIQKEAGQQQLLPDKAGTEAPAKISLLTGKRVLVAMGAEPITFTAGLNYKNCKEARLENATAKTKPVDPSLFTPSSVNETVSREQIPDLIDQLVAGYAKVVGKPADYRTDKPNMYLVSNHHFVRDESPFDPELVYDIQANIVRTFHQLFPLGVGRQFLEGVEAGMEIQSNIEYKGMESPVNALPEYKRTGKIRRASRAIAGIYGEDVLSIGAERDIAQLVQTKAQFDSADKSHYKTAFYEIFAELAKRLEIPQNIGINKQVIWDKVKDDAPLRAKLIDEVMLANPNYRKYLEAYARFAYMRTKGRNLAYAGFINEQAQKRGGDAVFIIGANHIPHLRGLLDKYNVFILQPHGVAEDPLSQTFNGLREEKDYRDNMVKNNAWIFGLAEKEPSPNAAKE